MNDVGGGAGYDQYDGYGGVASPMQRSKSRREISGSNHVPGVGAEDNYVIIAPVTRRALCISHLLDRVCNYMKCPAYHVSLAFDIVVLQAAKNSNY
jgi:hypothetical protein